jgi:hypothetical protein
MKVYIDRNSVVDGVWDDYDGRYCWIKITDMENGKEAALEYRSFFDNRKKFAVITDCKANNPKFTGSNLVHVRYTGKNVVLAFQPGISQDYVGSLIETPMIFGTFNKGVSQNIISLQARLANLVWDKP